MLQAAKGNKYCLLIVDSFTKWIEAIPTCNNTATTTAQVSVEQVFSGWEGGLPKEIDLDQGSHFVGEITQVVYQSFGIKQRLHIAGHHQSLGQMERTNRNIKLPCRKWSTNKGKTGIKKLSLILIALRATVAAHGITPYKAMTG